MVDFLGFIVGMAVLLGGLFLLVYPVTESFARGRLETATGIHGKNINPESIPVCYYSFFGTLIFTVIGFLMGVLFGMFFIGISLRGKDIPGVLSLIVASVSGSMLVAQPGRAGFVPYSLGFLIVLMGVSVILIARHDAKTMQWLSDIPAPAGKPATPVPVSTQSGVPSLSVSVSATPQKSIARSPVLPGTNQFCIHCGNRVLKSHNFCNNCGKTPDK
jgi:hypothetical protein